MIQFLGATAVLLKDTINLIFGDLRGVAATDEEIEMLKLELPDTLRPPWLLELFSFPLAGELLELPAQMDESGFGASMIWLDVPQLLSECLDAEPGRSVLLSGFLPIGNCALGSSDPYFLDMRDSACLDPPLVRIPHDLAAVQPFPLERIEPVCISLSVFLNGAKIVRKSCRACLARCTVT